MRILMISDVFFPRVNGVSTSIDSFYSELKRLGHHVMLIAPDYGTPCNNPDIIRIPSRQVIIDPEDRMMRGDAIQALLPELQRHTFDVIHIQTPFIAHRQGMWLARKLNVPVIETYHTYFEEYLYCYIPWLPRSWMRAVARFFTRRQCNQIDRVVVPSSAMAEVLRRYGVTTPQAIIPTGIGRNAFGVGDGARFRKKYGIAPDRPTLVYVGRVAHEKNIQFLLNVLLHLKQRLPEILLIIAGEGPARHSLQAFCHQHGLEENVLFVGYLSRDGALQDCYCAGDLFVFASRTETQGLVLLEAMALGIPVLSTAVMGTIDVLQPDSGAVVVNEDVEQFATKTLALLNDFHRRVALGIQASRYARRWSSQHLTEVMVQGYRSLVDGRRCHENDTRASSSLHNHAG